MAAVAPSVVSSVLTDAGGARTGAGSVVLAEAPMRQPFQVIEVVAPAGQPDWAERLAEIGFLAGEQVQVLSRGVPGGDPIAVRVGTSTFALRRAEAACVRIVRIAPQH